LAKLIYSAITSVDGYVSDARGNFDWAAPDEEVHRFVNAQERPIGTYLYGRRMYETMVFWETALDAPDQPAFVREYAEIWQAADKVVTRRRCKPSPARGPASNAASIRKPFANSRRQRARHQHRRTSPGGRGDPLRSGR